MKIALAQINPTIGDFDGNCQQILQASREASAKGVALVVFSEMCVMGYPARDLLEKSSFLLAQNRALEFLRHELRFIPVILGVVRSQNENTRGSDRVLYNSCLLIENGEITGCGDKCLLPTYDVFDEDRYFEPATTPAVVSFQGVRLGLTICEDIWNDKDFWSSRKYDYDPVTALITQGADLIVNISASPFSLGKQAVKKSMLASIARKYRRPLLYVNQVGGNDDLLFDGRSLAFDANGNVLAQGPAFKTGVTVVDFDTPPADVKDSILDVTDSADSADSEEAEVYQALVMGTRDYARKCGFKTAVLGLSGGIDSALVATIAVDALGAENVTGVALPSRFNAPESLGDARELAKRLGIHFQVVEIENLALAYKHALAPVFAGRAEDVTEENIQARIRGVVLMAMSNKFGHLLLTTGNKSELATGYCTLYGDMCGGLAVISDVYKTLVYRISNYLNRNTTTSFSPIPQSTIDKAPTAELRFDQKDQDTLPPYEILDGILKASIEDQRSAEEIVALGYSEVTVREILRKVDFNEYKRRQAAPGLKLTSKAFGTGRRMPIAQRFRDNA